MLVSVDNKNEIVFDKCKPESFLQVLFWGIYGLRQWCSYSGLKSKDKSLRTIVVSSRFRAFSCLRRLDGLPLLEFCRLDLLSQRYMTCGRVVYSACAMTRT